MNSATSHSLLAAQQHLQSADVYTDLASLQQLKASDDKDDAMRKVAQQFESIFIGMMLKSMRDANAVFEEGSLFNSGETKFYRDMYDQQLSLSMAHTQQGGIGIAEAMYRQMSQSYGDNRTSSAAESRLSMVTPLETDSSVNTSLENVPASSIPTGSLPARVTPEGNEQLKNRLVKPDSVSPLLPLPAKTISVNAPLTLRNEPEAAVPVVTKSANDKPPHYFALAHSPESFIRVVSPIMAQAAKALGIDSAILTAQAALETGWGQSVLKNSNGESSFNVFNIKAGQQWQGDTLDVSTLEYSQGTFKPEQATFRAYDSIEHAVTDYVAFVQQNPRYHNALKANDGGTYIHALQKAGYATDPDYANKILSIRERIVTGDSALKRTDS
ncbi:flagellar assembly peptidoglycan hydrolase FlgJ [Teredinibacter purpureus]|uniref:flagellar assembly peptidoglycan hydrolase FlgJ n=1 Tax=Teredinibacter purpureus TaxID=2731756 RepID=UPI0005F82DF6|nr:flagellar assembly peptidoglycan hydrolase FlgJ [Teredinibacter purpureus]